MYQTVCELVAVLLVVVVAVTELSCAKLIMLMQRKINVKKILPALKTIKLVFIINVLNVDKCLSISNKYAKIY